MSGYRDSHFQYHHLTDSHQVLYQEWNQDDFPPPDEQEVGNHLNNNNNNGGNNKNSSNDFNDRVNSKSYNNTHNSINAYWDYFHDEEDWNLFRNVQLESNGVATFNPPIDLNAENGVTSSADGTENDHIRSSKESAVSITGSIFNHSVTRMAIARNSNWNDLDIPHPPDKPS